MSCNLHTFLSWLEDIWISFSKSLYVQKSFLTHLKTTDTTVVWYYYCWEVWCHLIFVPWDVNCFSLLKIWWMFSWYLQVPMFQFHRYWSLNFLSSEMWTFSVIIPGLLFSNYKSGGEIVFRCKDVKERSGKPFKCF